MSNSFFFLQVEQNQKNSSLISFLESFSGEEKKQIYVIDKPLGDSKYTYDYSEALVILIPNYQLIFVDYGDKSEEFEEYVDDFIEDLGSISDKFRYKEIIGRPKNWKKDLVFTVNSDDIENNPDEFLKDLLLSTGENKKKAELLISLLTGSINDIEKVKDNVPDNVLDKIKQKILLFDGDQTRFVYEKTSKDRITIQGLSGTGKTELLLHKLKDLYVAHKESRIMFTCHNKILAGNLKNRIPAFFNFMKVEEQIEWDKRLWCVNAWGSGYDKNTGAYRFICDFYNIQFYSFSRINTFEKVCERAFSDISESDLEKYGFAFDYILLDESQDFPQSFLELCVKVTRYTVYIAGDIFQSIFDDKVISEIQPDFLLSKCYRTDPRTLMFAHAIGMGLFENPKLRWLDDKEWNACGYNVKKDDTGKEYELTREPLRRFEDLEDEKFSSIEVVRTSKDAEEDAVTKIIGIIKDIKKENPTVLADDIGIIFIENNKQTYFSADSLEYHIPREFDWEVNKAYETKEKVQDTLFISNRNNVKGLEFPFVICVTVNIQSSRSYRNALYMMLTRSFLKSYLLISNDNNSDLADKLESGLGIIHDKGNIEVVAPSDEEIARIKTIINYDEENISYYDSVYAIFDELDIIPDLREKLFNVVKNTVGGSFDYEDVKDVVEFNYEKMKK